MFFPQGDRASLHISCAPARSAVTGAYWKTQLSKAVFTMGENDGLSDCCVPSGLKLQSQQSVTG